jgi:sporulation protein YlmC with PRC-barrel domain
MKQLNKLFLTGAAVALSTGLTLAQNTPSTTRQTDTDTQSRVLPDTTRSTTLSTDQNTVTKVNKASGLMGMDVRNQQDERLGEIKDLVVDLTSGKIAYAVLSVGGFLGIGDKLIAVPTSAFSLSPDQERLVLNADKARIQNSPGFAKNDWPDLNSPDWARDSQYWLSDTAQGTLGTTSSGIGLGTDADRVQSGTRSSTEANRALDRATTDADRALDRATTDADRALDRSTTTTTRDRDAADRLDSSLDRTSNQNVFKGRITAISPETRTMTVEGDSGKREFTFAERPTITLKDNRNPRLSDLRVGYPVSVGFEQEDGKYVAKSVTRTDTPEVR